MPNAEDCRIMAFRHREPITYTALPEQAWRQSLPSPFHGTTPDSSSHRSYWMPVALMTKSGHSWEREIHLDVRWRSKNCV